MANNFENRGEIVNLRALYHMRECQQCKCISVRRILLCLTMFSEGRTYTGFAFRTLPCGYPFPEFTEHTSLLMAWTAHFSKE